MINKKKELEIFSKIDLNSDLKHISFESFLYFIVLADLRNFTLAAEKLCITQQTLSKAVSKIESELNVKLIDRKYKDNSLTSEGEFFLEKAKKIIGKLYDIKSIPEQNQIKSVFTIVYSNLYISLHDVIKDFRNNHKDLLLEIYIVNENEIENLVLNDNADIALSYIKPISKDLKFLSGQKYKHVIASKENKKQKWEKVNFIENKFLSKNSVSDWDDEKFRRNENNITSITNSLGITIDLAKIGKGSIYVNELIIKDEIEKKELFINSNDPNNKYIENFLIWKKENEIIKDFIDIFKNKYEK